MTLLKTLPGDAMRAMMEFDRCKSDPVVWRSMVLAILLEREELLLRQASDHRWVIFSLALVIISWGGWAAVIYSLMVRS
jgi:hypothetical protein